MKKVQLVGKKVRLETRGFRAYFLGVDYPLWDVIGVQDFGEAKNFKPTWTKAAFGWFLSCVGIKHEITVDFFSLQK